MNKEEIPPGEISPGDGSTVRRPRCDSNNQHLDDPYGPSVLSIFIVNVV